MFTVYSQPGCHACHDTVAYLTAKGASFTEVDITKDPEGLAVLERLGSQSTPTVVTESGWWIGHRPEKIDQQLA